MYLYFDKKGRLKEIINDEALRQGNYGINKMYIYIDGRSCSRIDASFLLPSGLIVGPTSYSTVENTSIPFDAKRDLFYFKYYTNYNFLVVDLENDVNDNSPLDEAGVVHSSLSAILTDGQLQLGDVNFTVEADAVLNQKQVASQEYLSLGDYLYLKSLVDGCVPYTGATDNVDLGSNGILANFASFGHIKAKGVGEYEDSEVVFNFSNSADVLTLHYSQESGGTNKVIEITTGGSTINFNPDNLLQYAGNEIATQTWVSSYYIPLIPAENNSIDIGSSDYNFKDLYVRNIKSSTSITISSLIVGIKSASDYTAYLLGNQLTADRNIAFPDKAGTIALTDDCTKLYNHAIIYNGSFTKKTVSISLADGTITTNTTTSPAFGIVTINIVTNRSNAFASKDFSSEGKILEVKVSTTMADDPAPGWTPILTRTHLSSDGTAMEIESLDISAMGGGLDTVTEL